MTPRSLWGGRGLAWFDALGLVAYATYGAAKGLAYGVAPVPAFGMGVLTACFGGIIRDLLAEEPSILLRPELYITAAALSSGSTVAFTLCGLPDQLQSALQPRPGSCCGQLPSAGAGHFLPTSADTCCLSNSSE